MAGNAVIHLGNAVKVIKQLLDPFMGRYICQANAMDQRQECRCESCVRSRAKDLLKRIEEK